MRVCPDHKKEERLGHSVSGEAAEPTLKGRDVRNRIAVRAYELYQERGGHDGHDLDDWLEAEQPLSALRQQSVDASCRI